MDELEGSSKFVSILSKIHKLADKTLELSETRRSKENGLSDVIIQLYEERRLVERANSDEARGVAKQGFNIAKKSWLTEHDHSVVTSSLYAEPSNLEASLTHHEIDKLNQQIIRILKSMHETCLFFYNYHLIYVNTQTQNLYWPKENIIGKTLSELLPKDISELFLESYRDNKISIPILRLESNKFRDKKWFQFLFYPSDSGFLVCFNDITQTKQTKKTGR